MPNRTVTLKAYQLIPLLIAMRQFADIKTAGELGYKIARIKRKLEEEVRFYSEQETELLDEYAIKDDYGNPTIIEVPGGEGRRIDPTRRAEFARKRRELENTEIQFSDLPNITSSELMKLTAATPTALESLLPFMDTPKPNKEMPDISPSE